MHRILKYVILLMVIICTVGILTGCGVGVAKEETKQEEFSMGEWKDNLYTNNYLGIKFRLPNGWKYANNEQIAALVNIGKEFLTDQQKFAEEMKKSDSVYYMVATNSETNDNIMVMTEKVKEDETLENYISQLKEQLNLVENIKYTVKNSSNENIAGKLYYTLTAEANIENITLTQKYYVSKMNDNILAIIATSSSGEKSIDNMINLFE